MENLQERMYKSKIDMLIKQGGLHIIHTTRLKNIKNVTRCRDSGTPKSKETR